MNSGGAAQNNRIFFNNRFGKKHAKKYDTNFFFKMLQIGCLGTGIVQIGAVKQLVVWYRVYK